MSSERLRLLFFSDTHLGFAPRSRTGEDISDEYFSNFHHALEPAFRSEVDFVVHGGDVFYRSRIKPGLVFRAFEPLKKIADSGIPVFVVPGNHERSAIPFPLLAAHPGVHIFDRPRTFVLKLRGATVAVSGFPNDRNRIADLFPLHLSRTEWRSQPADIRLLVMHQTVEGAVVGPVNFMFRRAADVIQGRAIPGGFAAVLSGHIHRHQLLTSDSRRRPLASPVFFPGSTTRTSGAERFEPKGFLTMTIAPAAGSGGSVSEWTFHELSPPNSAAHVAGPSEALPLPSRSDVRHLERRLRDQCSR